GRPTTAGGRARRPANPLAAGRFARARRGPRPAGAVGPDQGPTRHSPLLRRDDDRTGGGGARHLAGDGASILDVRPRLAAPADDRGRARIGISKKMILGVERAAPG